MAEKTNNKGNRKADHEQPKKNADKKVNSAQENQEHMHQTDTSNTDNTRNTGAQYEKERDTARQLDSNPAERNRLEGEGKKGSPHP